MKTVLVLTAIERAFYSATIEYQLVDPLLKVAQKRRDIQFVFLALVPFTFYFVRGEKRASFAVFRKRRIEIKNRIEKKGVKIFFVPVLYPLRHRSFYLKWFEMPLFFGTNFAVFLFFQILFYPVLIHARGYPASFLAHSMKKLRRSNFIFDMRDVYQLKGIEGGIFKGGGISFRMWQILERRMLDSADGVLVTSRPFRSYVEQKGGGRSNIWLVPNCVNRHRFCPNGDIREIVRRGLGIDKRFVLLHSGTFSTFKDIGIAVRYFKKWRVRKDNAFFLVLTPNRRNAERISEVFKAHEVSADDFRILTPEPEEVPDILRAGDVGLHLEGKALATEYCIAIKDGEYLATGLPVICTPFLKGIAPLVEKYHCGMVIDPEQETSFEKEQKFLTDYDKLRANTKRIVDEVLSLENTAKTLRECYSSLLDVN